LTKPKNISIFIFIMNKIKVALLAAGSMLAVAFILSCSEMKAFLDDFKYSCPECSCPDPVVSDSSLTCGGQTYRTVKIGDQIWMAENLNYNSGKGNSACYDNNPENCLKYGRLYDWATVVGADSTCNDNYCDNHLWPDICPEGWYVPGERDWKSLINAIGDSLTAGTFLKAAEGWDESGNGTDDYGFSALPGGGNIGIFFNAGNSGYWHINHESTPGGCLVPTISYENGLVSYNYFSKENLFSVRCVKSKY
jgi:uncharacterized protein (TIGR02145 family)